MSEYTGHIIRPHPGAETVFNYTDDYFANGRASISTRIPITVVDEFIRTLTMTSLVTGWSEIAPIPNTPSTDYSPKPMTIWSRIAQAFC